MLQEVPHPMGESYFIHGDLILLAVLGVLAVQMLILG
jgi:hypothetical protein